MTDTPFEDDARRALRERCMQAVERAEYSVVMPLIDLELPPELKMNGTLRGDIQVKTSTGVLHIYFLRSDSEKPVPGWLLNYARALAQTDKTEIYVVVPITSRSMEQTCKSVGYGLLALTEDNNFDLIIPASIEKIKSSARRLQDDVRSLRRELDAQVNIQRTLIENNVIDTATATAQMTTDKKVEYLEFAGNDFEALETWRTELSSDIDKLQNNSDKREIEIVKKRIRIGIPSNA